VKKLLVVVTMARIRCVIDSRQVCHYDMVLTIETLPYHMQAAIEANWHPIHCIYLTVKVVETS